jgi:DNA polymerase III subunit epsilon
LKLLGLDIETTGLLTPDHRIVEVYAGLWDDGKLVAECNTRIDPQRGMPAEAQRVHKISAADLTGMPLWGTVAPKLMRLIERADVYVWHNGDEFDGPFLDMEFMRVGLPKMPVKPSLDTMKQGLWATHDGKRPRLQEVCFALGVTYDPALAHGARYDVHRMMDCLKIGRHLGFYTLPALPVPVTAACAA